MTIDTNLPPDLLVQVFANFTYAPPVDDAAVADIKKTEAFMRSISLIRSAVLRLAWSSPDYRLAAAGFFACGFQLAFLACHLPGHLALCGLAFFVHQVGSCFGALMGGAVVDADRDAGPGRGLCSFADRRPPGRGVGCHC